MTEMLHEMPAADRKVVESLPGNSVCMECGAKGPEWASVTLSLLLCLECSGKHRGLGTHLSFVRSITMDSWSDKQLKSMKVGGNQACREFLAKHEVDDTRSAKEKYDTPAAELYRQVLKARVEGRPEPTKLPPPSSSTANSNADRPMQGFGSGPHPAEERRRKRRQMAIAVAGSAAAVAVGLMIKR